jgi:1,2-diacylglycerol 3-alpha-glucosyltransferase
MKPKKAGLYVLGMPKNPFLERLYRLFMFLDRKKISRYTNILKKYDLIISHLYPMNILAKKAKKKNKRLKYLYHNAGVGIVDTYSFLEKLYLKLFTFLNNRSISNCDSAISISKFLKGILKKETGINSKVEYIEIDKKRFHKGIKGSSVRKLYGAKGPLFFYVGRISPHKGIHLLIEAFNLVQKKYPKAKLIIAGKPTFPKYSRQLKQMADKNVIFAGFLPDKHLPMYYSAADVYTTATLWEGFDMPIAEAYECGTPAVAFDVGAHREVIKKGILVKPKDTRVFADAIIKLLKG